MIVGIVKTFLPNRQFGFLQTEDGREIFFHISNIKNGIPKLGQSAQFELGPAVKLGQPDMAVRIQLIHEGLDSLASADSKAGQ
jgi:cold shock CspA family protein